jgi:CDP-6-deoxy-D-xylo-4-hexulose-3-dehydrase
MSNKWSDVIRSEYESRQKTTTDKKLFPLIARTFGCDEIISAVDCLLSGRLTMGSNVTEFEHAMAEYLGVKYAVMVNSGSSANLLAISLLVNKLSKYKLCPGDEVMVPIVCWSTSVWPIVQLGLTPVFVDVEHDGMNMCIDDMIRKMSSKTKAVMLIHVLGTCCDMERMSKFVKQHDLFLIEDTCESLGSKYNNRLLGTIGDIGTFSFYYSHHITTGEGGLVVTNNKDDYDILMCMRSHGWSRNLSNRTELEMKYKDVDPRFLFVNSGYNLRPLEISGCIGLKQLEKLDEMNSNRCRNYAMLKNSLLNHPKYTDQFVFIEPRDKVDVAWFGMPLLLNTCYRHQYSSYIKYLSNNGIENRPLISGNFARQPCLAAYNINLEPNDFPNGEHIGSSGFFIGLHTTLLKEEQISTVCNIMLSYSFIRRHRVLVTGSSGTIGSNLRQFIEDTNDPETDYFFTSSSDCDLRSIRCTELLFSQIRPTRVIHLAACVKGYHKIANDPVDIFQDNIDISFNIIKCVHKYRINKTILLLSGMAYPSSATIPISEHDLLSGKPDSIVEPYAYSKRFINIMSSYYNKQYKTNIVNVIPSNILDVNSIPHIDGPIVNAIKAKVLNAAKNNEEHIYLHGSGVPRRQFLFASDLSKLLLLIINDHRVTDDTINIAGHSYTIDTVAKYLIRALGYNMSIKYIPHENEVIDRSFDITKIKMLYPDFKYSTLSSK